MSKYRAAGPAGINLGRVVRSPRARLYLYGVLGAAAPLLVTYGIVTDTEVALWLSLAGTILATGGLGLASANVPTERDERDED